MERLPVVLLVIGCLSGGTLSTGETTAVTSVLTISTSSVYESPSPLPTQSQSSLPSFSNLTPSSSSNLPSSVTPSTTNDTEERTQSEQTDRQSMLTTKLSATEISSSHVSTSPVSAASSSTGFRTSISEHENSMTSVTKIAFRSTQHGASAVVPSSEIVSSTLSSVKPTSSYSVLSSLADGNTEMSPAESSILPTSSVRNAEQSSPRDILSETSSSVNQTALSFTDTSAKVSFSVTPSLEPTVVFSVSQTTIVTTPLTTVNSSSPVSDTHSPVSQLAIVSDSVDTRSNVNDRTSSVALTESSSMSSVVPMTSENEVRILASTVDSVITAVATSENISSDIPTSSLLHATESAPVLHPSTSLTSFSFPTLSLVMDEDTDVTQTPLSSSSIQAEASSILMSRSSSSWFRTPPMVTASPISAKIGGPSSSALISTSVSLASTSAVGTSTPVLSSASTQSKSSFTAILVTATSAVSSSEIAISTSSTLMVKSSEFSVSFSQVTSGLESSTPSLTVSRTGIKATLASSYLIRPLTTNVIMSSLPVTPQVTYDIRFMIVFSGDCERLRKNRILQMEFWTAVSSVMKSKFNSEIHNDNIVSEQFKCDPLILVITMKNLVRDDVISVINASIANSTFDVPVLDEMTLVTYKAIRIKQLPLTIHKKDYREIAPSGLEQVDIIIIVIAGFLFVFFMIMAGIFCCRECYKNKRAASFNLLDVPHVDLKLEDFTLTRIPRPRMRFSENGRPENPGRHHLSPEVSNGRSPRPRSPLNVISHHPYNGCGKTGQINPENIRIRMKPHAGGLVVGITCTPPPSPTRESTSGSSSPQSGYTDPSKQTLLKGHNSSGGTTNPNYTADDEVPVSYMRGTIVEDEIEQLL